MLSARSDGHPVIQVKSAEYMTRLHRRLEAQGRMPMWVVYRPVTLEYPGKWCARMHVAVPVGKPTRFTIIHDSLSELRSILPPGLFWIPRDPSDAPQIEETWI